MRRLWFREVGLGYAVVSLVLSSAAQGVDIKSVCFNYVASCQAAQRAMAHPALAAGAAESYEQCKSWERRARAQGFDDARCGTLLYGQPKNLAVREPPGYRGQGVAPAPPSRPGTVWVDARPSASGGRADARRAKPGVASGPGASSSQQPGRWACDKETACSGEDHACREAVRRQCGR